MVSLVVYPGEEGILHAAEYYLFLRSCSGCNSQSYLACIIKFFDCRYDARVNPSIPTTFHATNSSALPV